MTTIAAPTLRWYQEEALDALFDWFQTRDGDPLITLPTGSGKSLLLSAFLQRARSNYPQLRAVVLATQAELVKQNARAARLLMPHSDVGIYSASVGTKDASRPVTVANIQSIARVPYGLDPFDVIVVDEAHTIADADSGQYRQFIEAQRLQNPHVRVVGLTATPYKLSSGLLTEGKSALFQGVAYEASIQRLIDDGFLARPITPRTTFRLDASSVAMRGGEYIAKALAEAVDIDATTESAVAEMVQRFHDRHHWVVFAVSVDHATHIGHCLERHQIKTTVVHGELSRDERAYRLHAFDSGEVRAIVNCQLLTTGWDCQKIDAIGLMRPTKSAGLYVQMLGRGMRIHPSKTDCLVADFAGLIETFGPIDAIHVRSKTQSQGAPADPIVKVCPSCELYVPSGVRLCPGCEFEFPPPPVKLTPTASTRAILAADATPEWYEVTRVEYSRHSAKPPKTTDTLRATYYNHFRPIISEWVCIEHDGFARSKAERWFQDRCPEACPNTIERAVQLLENEGRVVRRVAVAPDPANPKYRRLVQIEYTDSPPPKAPGLPKACWSCCHYSDPAEVWEEPRPHCLKWDAMPPADVLPVGCDAWDDSEPDLPF